MPETQIQTKTRTSLVVGVAFASIAIAAAAGLILYRAYQGSTEQNNPTAQTAVETEPIELYQYDPRNTEDILTALEEAQPESDIESSEQYYDIVEPLQDNVIGNDFRNGPPFDTAFDGKRTVQYVYISNRGQNEKELVYGRWSKELGQAELNRVGDFDISVPYSGVQIGLYRGDRAGIVIKYGTTYTLYTYDSSEKTWLARANVTVPGENDSKVFDFTFDTESNIHLLSAGRNETLNYYYWVVNPESTQNFTTDPSTLVSAQLLPETDYFTEVKTLNIELDTNNVPHFAFNYLSDQFTNLANIPETRIYVQEYGKYENESYTRINQVAGNPYQENPYPISYVHFNSILKLDRSNFATWVNSFRKDYYGSSIIQPTDIELLSQGGQYPQTSDLMSLTLPYTLGGDIELTDSLLYTLGLSSELYIPGQREIENIEKISQMSWINREGTVSEENNNLSVKIAPDSDITKLAKYYPNAVETDHLATNYLMMGYDTENFPYSVYLHYDQNENKTKLNAWYTKKMSIKEPLLSGIDTNTLTSLKNHQTVTSGMSTLKLSMKHSFNPAMLRNALNPSSIDEKSGKLLITPTIKNFAKEITTSNSDTSDFK